MALLLRARNEAPLRSHVNRYQPSYHSRSDRAFQPGSNHACRDLTEVQRRAADVLLFVGVSRICGSGRNGGAQPLDALAERGVLDLSDEGRRRVERALIAERGAQ